MAYSSRDKLIVMFGLTQLIKWADIDGERQDHPIIQERINEALEDADSFINERLADNGYDVPFAAPFPRRIISLATLYAGIYLYDMKLKGGAENSARDEVARPRKRFNTMLRQILDGQIHLLNPLSGEVIAKHSGYHPFVAGVADVSTLNCNDPTCLSLGWCCHH